MSQLNGEDLEKIVELCLKAAFPNDIVALMLYGPYAYGCAKEETAINILLITNSDKASLKHQVKRLDSKKIRILVVDKETFEKDVENELVGGILADTMLTPYKPLINDKYLWSQEVKFKKRIIEETLNNLILSFPNMSKNFIIKPKYFMFEAIARRVALFPPVVYRFLNTGRKGLKEKNYSLMINGFKAAIEELAKEGKIHVLNDSVKISEEYALKIRKKPRIHLKTLLEDVRRSIIRYVLNIFPNFISSLLEEYRIYKEFLAEKRSNKTFFSLENPKKYIFIPTSSGMVSFSDKITIEDFIRKRLSEKYVLKHRIRKLGGALNTTYLLDFLKSKGAEKFVVKIFKDWYGWKWFPIALWALGTRGFAVMGKSRLEKEYTINMLLSSHGINVPKIIYVSPEEKIIFREYVKGNSISNVIRKICKTENKKKVENLLKVIREVGREVAAIHKLNVALGDCKPENMVITPDGRIFFLDLEQAEEGGDKSWDIAEFIFYSSYHALFSPTKKIEAITKEFILGYLEAGGEIKIARKALSPRYLKVFSFFTPPHLLFTVINTCRKVLKTEVKT